MYVFRDVCAHEFALTCMNSCCTLSVQAAQCVPSTHTHKYICTYAHAHTHKHTHTHTQTCQRIFYHLLASLFHAHRPVCSTISWEGDWQALSPTSWAQASGIALNSCSSSELRHPSHPYSGWLHLTITAPLRWSLPTHQQSHYKFSGGQKTLQYQHSNTTVGMRESVQSLLFSSHK